MAGEINVENLYGHRAYRARVVANTSILPAPYSASVTPTTYGTAIPAPTAEMIGASWDAGSWPDRNDQQERDQSFYVSVYNTSSAFSNYVIGGGESASFTFDAWNGVDSYVPCTLAAHKEPGYQLWHIYWQDSNGNTVSDEITTTESPQYALSHTGYIFNPITEVYDAGLMLFIRATGAFGSKTDNAWSWFKFNNMDYNDSSDGAKIGIDRLLPFYLGQVKIQDQPTFLQDPIRYQHVINRFINVKIT